jgi:anti-sigma regulatory factor (Ser/Thr protein kinase)
VRSAEPLAVSDDLGSADLDRYRWQQWSVPADASSVPFLRAWLRALLNSIRLTTAQVDDLLLAVGEAVRNAVEHAQHPTRPCIDMTVELADSRVTVVVRDYGAWRQGPTGRHRGRGLALLSALADATLTASSNGTTVTIRGPVPHR